MVPWLTENTYPHDTFKDDIVDTQTLSPGMINRDMFRERDEFISMIHSLFKKDKSKKKPN